MRKAWYDVSAILTLGIGVFVFSPCVLRRLYSATSVRRLKFRNGIGWRKPVPFVNDRRLVWCASTEAVLDSMSQAVSIMVDRVGRCFVSTKQACYCQLDCGSVEM